MLWVGLIPLLGFVGLLCIPIKFFLGLHVGDEQRPQVEWRIFWGAFPLPKPGRKDKTQQTKAKKTRPSKAKTAMQWLKLAKNPRLRRHVISFFKRMLKTLHVRRAHLWVRGGFEDPSETGRLCGYLLPMMTGIPKTQHLTLRFDPVFHMEGAEGDGEICVFVYPIEIVIVLLIYTLSPVMVKAFWGSVRLHDACRPRLL
jgi:hypothetical protein